MSPEKSGQLRQAQDLELTLERLLNDARLGKLKGAVLACKYSVWHHGVWVVGDYVTDPDEALEATAKIVASLREYSGSIPGPHAKEPVSPTVGMLYRMILPPDGKSYFPFVTDACRRIFRVTPEQLHEDGKHLDRTIHPEDLARLYKYFAEEIAPTKGGFWQQRYRVVFPDGTGHWVMSKAEVKLLPNGDYQFDGVIVEDSDS